MTTSLEKTPSVTIRNAGLTAGAIMLAFAACYFAKMVLFQLIFSFYFFFFLNPLVEWGTRKRIPRKVGAVIVVVGLMLVSAGATWGSIGAISSLAQEVPQYTAKIKKTLASLRGQADELQKNASGILPAAPESPGVQKVDVVEHFGGGTRQEVLQGVGSVAEAVAAVFLVPILLLFLLLEKAYFTDVLENIVPEQFRLGQASREMSEMVTGFFFGNLLVGFGSSLGFYALFTVMHLDNRLLLSLVAGFINLIPMVGAVLAGLFPMFQALLQFNTAGPALTIFGTSLFLHFFIANFIIPKVVGSRINVNATAATIGLIFWGWLWGPVGLLLAVPLTATIRIFLSARTSTENWSRLIAEESAGNMTRLTYK